MNNKDTIYIDIDDEITGIIDKVTNSDSRIVALVLPKRASVLQSIVNMKLLKRTADNAKKQVVLITSETGLLPLAGSVGLYVASTPQSKPAIPNNESMAFDDDSDEAVHLDDFDSKAAAAVPVGALVGAKAASAVPPAKVVEEAETVQLDDDAPTVLPAKPGKKPKKDKKLAVPNFSSFRKRLIFGALALILLIGLGYVAAVLLPKATVTATTDTSTINTRETLSLSTEQDEVDADNLLVPAQYEQTQKTTSQQTPATGTKNAGTRATGSVTISIRNCTEDSVTVPAGTGVSKDGQTFITQSTAQLESVKIGGRCIQNNGSSSKSVDVTAAAAGSQYNLPAGSFTVASLPDGTDPNHLAASSSSAFTGGSDNTIKVVSQADIDTAKQKLTAADNAGAKNELVKKLESAGLQAVDVTFVAGTPSVTSTANAGDQADNVTVTQTITYSIFGVKKSDLLAIIKDNVDGEIDPAKQQIQNDGLSEASYKLDGSPSSSRAQVAIEVSSTAGPKLDIATIKKQIAGKKSGDVQTYLKSTPGVEDVTVKFNPFWVTSVPKDGSKVTVDLVESR